MVLVTPKVSVMRREKTKATMLHSMFHLQVHVAYQDVGGVTAGHWMIGLPCATEGKEVDFVTALKGYHI
eukprot:8956493-Ditylum_brightwellii.AAC.1